MLLEYEETSAAELLVLVEEVIDELLAASV
jgi:hypothetical protein